MSIFILKNTFKIAKLCSNSKQDHIKLIQYYFDYYFTYFSFQLFLYKDMICFVIVIKKTFENFQVIIQKCCNKNLFGSFEIFILNKKTFFICKQLSLKIWHIYLEFN